ncbi:ribonucleoside-diphosphate reductase subunit alpha [Fusobacterium varium]|jgi:ribonucleoside-diphosphate reductase alpha chain|uniref:Ribonucleoside-diphosphate reductase n=1 Tax=Fusobacterium varium ATCC 27725 TaxID=469618 RepID=A0ABM6U3F4_FUSVA|nr:ribonucleoside-diphosphate reductase subunit alpha [Fusobacterium varium]AVQ30856.1 ribonucleoside-diphosphate reductase subunit alpha [Fusobacterium varium ATCC 27725]EES63666.1 ribonucleoside-diphosphate reductase, alpha subunit [Fusobacterium varium ATCC 27725]VEH40504.1 Ribonucleoside-diphosphate reductase 1 subunit alpha [Fusobacterium varium]
MREVINRAGIKENLDIIKIREKLIRACEGLEVNMVELESYIDSIYQENITTKKIQESLINQAVAMTSFEESDWTYVAGRLLMMETEREVFHKRGFSYGEFYKTIKTLTENGIYDNRLQEYTEDEIKELEKAIDISRDMMYDYAGANMFVNRYLLKYKGNIYELPQEVFMCIAMLLAINEENRVLVAKRFYNALSLKKISLATPILANLRIPKGNLSSCFITAMDDNIESIFYNIDTIAKISKSGGGVGLNVSRIRAKDSMVNGYYNASGGVVPWIKIVNDTAVAVNQQGRRAGAVTVALDSWHLDIELFLELQTENGDQRGKAYDIYPQVVLSDLFMKRVENNLEWTLVDPYEVRIKYGVELCELYGEKFEEIYKALEKDTSLKLKKVIKARELFKEIMKVQIETGMPYIFFKDRANLMNHNNHKGMIGNGNLCMESFSNFFPSKDFTEKVVEEKGVRSAKLGEVHTCNLVSLNLAEIAREELENIVDTAVRMLDNTIDLTKTPIMESDKHNIAYRTIGVGTMGLADYLAREFMIYDESLNDIDELFEEIALYSIKSSALLAKNRGQYPMFKGSMWDRGVFFQKNKDWYIKNSKYATKWNEVFELVAKYGMRNGELTAIAPNTSTSLLMGATASVNPTFSRFYIEKNQKGAVPRVVKYLKDRAWFYPEFKNVNPQIYVEIMSRIGKWTTQGVSMELIFDLNKNIRAKDIYNTLMSAWKNGCKSIYYIRTIQKNTNIMNEKEECESCSG